MKKAEHLADSGCFANCFVRTPVLLVVAGPEVLISVVSTEVVGVVIFSTFLNIALNKVFLGQLLE